MAYHLWPHGRRASGCLAWFPRCPSEGCQDGGHALACWGLWMQSAARAVGQFHAPWGEGGHFSPSLACSGWTSAPRETLPPPGDPKLTQSLGLTPGVPKGSYSLGQSRSLKKPACCPAVRRLLTPAVPSQSPSLPCPAPPFGGRWTESTPLHPRNPMGRTGLRGRGSLSCFGPNHTLYPMVTR